ncbi:helix-turn-helix transcriptional regulator [Blautia argi]|uniref:helix-turn-helix domain-containing protein n=1 Tax=Blautia argi TaxID=1912897 RepID=UPI0029420605|nr:helix-turn-helix transcriptional regulator [Blautia argi]
MTIKEANFPFDVGIAKLIQNKGIKQIYIANKAGYTAQELSDMLNGRKIIKLCDVPRLADALGEDIDTIYSAGEESE